MSLPYPLSQLRSQLPGIQWREAGAPDAEAVARLAADCLASDGGLPIAAELDFLRERLRGSSKCLWATEEGGDPAGFTCIQTKAADGAALTVVDGMVRPSKRGRGIGRALMQWAEAQSSGPRVVRTESLTAAAARLYERFRYRQTFAEDVMRRDLDRPVPAPDFPSGIRLANWAEAGPVPFFQAYDASFRDRPGFPGWPEEQWVDWIAADSEFLPERSLVAFSGEEVVAFIACAGEFIVQVGVVPSWRGRGLGRALVLDALTQARLSGSSAAWLDVNVDNPSAARLYQKLGFTIAGRRARYTWDGT